jgi:hypothetical protein
MRETIPVAVACVMVLATVGVLLRLFLEQCDPKETCPYCAGTAISRKTFICPKCHRALGKR